MMPPATTLDGITVMITRPQALSGNLATLVEEKGGRAYLYPVISIVDPDTTENLDALLSNLTDFDIAVFISPSSVNKTFERINSMPPGIHIAAIGSSTTHALENHGVDVSIKPEGHDSEALLRHAVLQPDNVTGKRIIIFRGQGGRELLGKTLTDRGAAVSYAETYKRISNPALVPLSTPEFDTIDIIAVTSNEGLQNLFDINNGNAALLEKPLLVPGIRSQQLAQKLGFRHVIQAVNATDQASIVALEQWAGGR